MTSSTAKETTPCDSCSRPLQSSGGDGIAASIRLESWKGGSIRHSRRTPFDGANQDHGSLQNWVVDCSSALTASLLCHCPSLVTWGLSALVSSAARSLLLWRTGAFPCHKEVDVSPQGIFLLGRVF